MELRLAQRKTAICMNKPPGFNPFLTYFQKLPKLKREEYRHNTQGKNQLPKLQNSITQETLK